MAQQEAASSTTLRLTLLILVVVGLLGALFSRLWFLQVLAGERYSELADRNRIRLVLTEAPRGRILDRHGVELVINRPALTVSAYPHRLLDSHGRPKGPEEAAVLDRLARVLRTPRAEIVERMTSRRYSPFRAVPIKDDVPAEVIFTIEERRELFAGVEAETLPLRTYPRGALAAHLVGYIGEISEGQLNDPAYADYRPGDLIGKAGLERSYERFLQGEQGLRKLEVNARGTILDVLALRDPVPGADLKTSLDLELQAEVEDLLQDGILASRKVRRHGESKDLKSVAGSAVILDPRSGEVLAMASWPTFEPSKFVGGISNADWAWLNDPVHEFPLINRAIQSEYPPGSTYKLVSAASALETGLIEPPSELPCPPRWKLANQTYRNWWPRHEGSLDVTRALMRSCDTFFYELAFRQWQREERAEQAKRPVDEAMQRMAREFGFGRALGIDLPGEQTGIIPDRGWRRRTWLRLRPLYCEQARAARGYRQGLLEDLCRYGGRWRGGDAVNMAIGQGDVLSTPLQVAAAFAAVANGGTLYRPHLGLEVRDPGGKRTQRVAPQVVNRVPLDATQLRALQLGLEQVVQEPRGTARSAFAGFPVSRIPVAGKTGTAQFGNRVPYAWFVAYAPTNDPRYVVVVSVEEGGGGSVTAAPIARRMLEAAFDLEVSKFRAGRPTD